MYSQTMLITSHVAATMVLAETFSLNGVSEWSAALVGGVLIDLDHFLVSKKWLSDVKMFFRGGVTHGETNQHSWLQEPFFGLTAGIAAGLCIAMVFPVRWWIIPLFQAVHIAMDACMRYTHQPLVPLSRWTYRGPIRSNSKIEFWSSPLLIVILWLRLFLL